jgi:hypothetical protein
MGTYTIKSACTHGGTTNIIETLSAQQACIQCNKENLAKIAHTEED